LTLKIEHVSKKLGAFSLREISLEIVEGGYFVLLGPTGAGKTVLLEVIMGFQHPDRGKILLNGQDITNVPTEKRGIAYVPQNCLLFPHMNVSDNVEFGLKMRRIAPTERKNAVSEMLKVMGLEEMAKRMPSTLSGGEKQKVVLSRVLVTKPRVVLLDEPLTAIDAETSRSLRDQLKRTNRESNVAFLHVTHDQIEAFSLADRIAVMMQGEIAQIGVSNEVFSNPANELVARFLGYMNVLRVEFMNYESGISEVSADGVSIRLNGKLNNHAATVAIHPEDIALTSEAPDLSDEWNLFEGRVEESTNLGPVVEVTVDAGVVLRVFLDKRSFLGMKLLRGRQVHVAFKTNSVKIVSMS
jgi:molybdate/tungstate transport system ATP-binding protein